MITLFLIDIDFEIARSIIRFKVLTTKQKYHLLMKANGAHNFIKKQ